MRSIRRSLLGYLLLLVAIALGAVAALVDRFANDAVRGREVSEADRIEQTFKVRQIEAKAKFDADLMTEAKSLAQVVHSQARSLVVQDFRPRPGPPPKAADMPPVPPALKAPEDEALQYRLRLALVEFAPGPGLWPAVAPAAAAEPYLRGDWRRHHPYPGWVEYDGPKALARIQESLRKSFAEDHPAHPVQFTLIATYPGRPGRNVATVRSEHLRGDLPLAAEYLEAPSKETEPKLDDLSVSGLGPCRRVTTTTLPSGRAIFFWFFLPSPAAVPGLWGGALEASRRYPTYQPWRGFDPRNADMQLRVVVHAVRPYSELDARLAADQQSRDEQLVRVREETRMGLGQLRARLILIGTGSFAALVLGGWFFVARGLSPLRKLSDAVSQVSERDFRLAVNPADLGHELAPIHARITQTLTLLQRAFAREKQAVADISHELRTPIASLLATIDVALRKPRTSDQYRTALEECRLISKQLGQLVERIMTLASLDAGNDHTTVSRTILSELTSGCAAVIRPLAAANNVSVSVALDDEVTLETDAGKLREVLMNLLHNAVEYNKPGGTIELAAWREGHSVLIEVRDTGIGMTPEVREKIFERFFRADASRHTTGVHAGLGLAIVREYVARLGGTIAVETAPGVGTTFRVTLPLTHPAALPGEVGPPAPATNGRARAPRVPAGS